jgi:hypothetical protein
MQQPWEGQRAVESRSMVDVAVMKQRAFRQREIARPVAMGLAMTLDEMSDDSGAALGKEDASCQQKKRGMA